MRRTLRDDHLEMLAQEENVAASANIEVTAQFPDNPFGLITNGQRNNVILSLNNKDAVDYSVLVVSGQITDREDNTKVVRNLTAIRVDAQVPAEATVDVPYTFYSEFAPGEHGLNIFVDLLNGENIVRIVGYSGVVSITNPEISWWDPELLFLYVLLAGGAVGLGYLIRDAFFGGSKKTKAKKEEPTVRPTHRDEKGQMVLDESWIPEQHLKNNSPKQSPKDQESKIRELEARIEQYKNLLDRVTHMRSLHTDRNAILQCETEIKDCQKTISYFTEELHKLRNRSSKSSFSTKRNSGDLESVESESTATLCQPPSPTAPIPVPKTTKGESDRKRYTNLDLLTAETPYNKPKVSLKLHELEYKLDVEQKVLTGIKTMTEVLNRDPSSSDRKRRGEVQGQFYESSEKLNLLKRALRKYKGLYIDEGDEDDYELETPPSARMPPGVRKPVTGKLQLQIIEARELGHAPTSIIKAPDTVVVVKIDGIVAFRTRPSRTDRWIEQCEIHVNKAAEVEIAVYDQGVERSLPIGLFWLKMTDIAEGLRKRKIRKENGTGWVSAEVAQKQISDTHEPYKGGPLPVPAKDPQIEPTSDGIQAWFEVEPFGEMALRLNFVRETTNRHPLDKLGRAGAMRQRPEEVHEMHGHQFVEKKIYNIMKCALCGEFMVNSGYQCIDCEYTCQKKCYQKVVTKCVTKSSSEADSDEDKINHRIPHRFVPITNIGANWCCHCGYMLPLGARGAKRCSECDVTCHTKCAHLVPDFCGLSMEMANQMLAEIKAAKRKTLETNTVSPSKSNRVSKIEAIEEPEAHEKPTSTTLVTSAIPPVENTPAVAPTESISSQMSKLSLQRPPEQAVQYQQPHPPPQVSRPPFPPSQTAIVSEAQQSARITMPMPYGRPPALPPHNPQYQYVPTMPYGDPRYHPYPQSMRPSMHAPPSYAPSPYSPIPNPALVGHSTPTIQPYQMEMVPRPRPVQPTPPSATGRKVGLENFNFQAVLGRGNFGKVMLAEDKYDKKVYAIKVLKKRLIIDDDELESLRSEKRIFQTANRVRHPFLVGLHSCFQTESRVYFVMEFVSGGDLMWHIQREPFSERRAKFYACEILLALEYFHSQGIIYRDLKLDNVMLGLDGHIKVADYGLCKESMWYGNQTGTFCGTPHFMAPEIVKGEKYGLAVDWWAFGVLVYEMLLSQSPFRGDDDDDVFDAILEDEILYPINMSRDSVSICQRLLTRDPSRRLGGGEADAGEVKAHPFFRGVNWDDMLAKRVPPPFYPSSKGPLDFSNFDDEFTHEKPCLTPSDTVMTHAEQQAFQAFSYTADWTNDNQPK
ncbi:Serine/threonine kinase [Apophysomyces ossiformis]|uniref:protein kinase C n=1 Tax=Apophysomyces ossiformis TaxID=679940 RepID=A0A8H7BUS3_9FUNG|nr:Serine/threonine kinase [Apophysomyces ossiformis]